MHTDRHSLKCFLCNSWLSSCGLSSFFWFGFPGFPSLNTHSALRRSVFVFRIHFPSFSSYVSDLTQANMFCLLTGLVRCWPLFAHSYTQIPWGRDLRPCYECPSLSRPHSPISFLHRASFSFNALQLNCCFVKYPSQFLRRFRFPYSPCLPVTPYSFPFPPDRAVGNCFCCLYTPNRISFGSCHLLHPLYPSTSALSLN